MTRVAMPAAAFPLLFVLGLCCSTVAFSASVGPKFSVAALDPQHRPFAAARQPRQHSIPAKQPLLFRLRGGEQEKDQAYSPEDEDDSSNGRGVATTMASVLAPMASVLQSAGRAYASSLNARPILTKSVTASLIFGLSDLSAQAIEGGKRDDDDDDDGGSATTKKKDWTRIATASAVGLFYFGPAAHYWYDTIFKILPGTSLASTLQKAALGQLLFGPAFTCIFFATSLMQAGTFSLKGWASKIRSDLPGAWAAGVGFWPFVDLVSYSMVPPKWIPLFVNFCSFLWTIYLSMVANRAAKED